MPGEFISKVVERRARLATLAGIAAMSGLLRVLAVAALMVEHAGPHPKST